MRHVLLLLAALLTPHTQAITVAVTDTPGGGLQPRVLVDAQGTLHVLWYAGDARGGDVFHATRNMENSWSKPVRVNSEPGSAIAAGTIRGAQFALGRDGFVHVVWNGSGAALPKGSHPPMFFTRSTDGGKTFGPQRAVSGEWPLDGGGAVAADGAGRVHVLWHAGREMGKGGEISRRVFIRTSEDDGKTFSEERTISPEGLGVCACCAMQALATKDGSSIHVLFRTAHDNGMSRHIVSLVSHDAGRTFMQSFVDKWTIAACPMSSMALVESPRVVLGAWEREGQVYFGLFNKGSTAPAKLVSPVGSGATRKHPVLAVGAGGQTLLAWTEGTGWQKGGSLAWEVFDQELTPAGPRGTSAGVPVWSFVGAASVDGGFVVMK